jgi:TonB family protein
MLADIVNHLWQSTLLVAAIGALAWLLREHGAHTRYWLWWAASVKFLVPFSLLTLLGDSLAGAELSLYAFAEWQATLGGIAEPMAEAASWTPVALALVGIWGLGCAAVARAWVARAFDARTLLRASLPYPGALPLSCDGPEVRSSRALVEPALVGVFRPVLLLPQDLTEHLTRAQLGAVVEHELAHWRRRDNLTAAVHMLVEAVFWFHPLVWWIGARLVEERERACDEAVVRAGHDARTYAEAILNVCQHYVASTLKCAAGISGADLKRRVVEIARSKAMSHLSTQKKILLGTFALSMFVVPIIFGAAAQGDANPRPLVRINPDYPVEALQAGREGVVELEFTIAANGTIKDVVVVDASSPEFEAPSVAALLRWRYAPLVENGAASERRGVRTTLRYQLQRDNGPPQ